MLRTLALAGLLASSVSFSAHAQENAIAPELLRLGTGLYAQHCAICHGPNGEGDGALAGEFTPKPRNFTNGNFKFKSSDIGEPPTRADLIKTIERGIDGPYGRSMPAFGSFTSSEKIALAEVVRQFAEIEAYGDPLVIPPKPERVSLDNGGALYFSLGCDACHGKTGAGDGDLSADLEDENFDPIRPANFTIGKLKGGTDATDIWLRVYGGVNGTPMPSYGQTVSPEELWELALLIEAILKK
ncbi:c-type cytochrome [bacterium]|nr:c-type cytochrome [bacterium]